MIMDIGNILVAMENLDRNELYKIKSYAEGLINKSRDMGISTTLPVVGQPYEIGDDRNGTFKVKVLKNRQSKALVEILERVKFGSRNKANGFDVGQQIVVPFTFFKM